MVVRNIIAIGASAGGIDALKKVVSGFPPELQAAVFITMHLYQRSESMLPEILNRVGPLQALHPWEECAIKMGRIYVAPPDYHLILAEGTVHVAHGPKENLQRPCINTMFRSAAAAYGERVAGVVLTGLLDDGAAGLWEIQQRGGATVVQDPDEAAYKSMPESAIRGLSVQYIVRLAEMPSLLSRLTMGDQNGRADLDLKREVVDDRVSQACPECGGVMKLHRLGKLVEYTCHVGHRIGLKTMIAEKSAKVERAIWTALSQSEELVDLLEQAEPDVDQGTASALTEEIDQRRNEQNSLRKLTERAKTLPFGTGQTF
jgi:two-component system chemotaxis response regulator CheB